ncbi:sigma-70 family RNA polymerase sigma factor [Lachnospiraceae bacterium NSJ-143]|nr:sigma-70 family RNA polymerase sigma factor [Lachnospiraceae bacterium NSJ-143]
MNSLPNSGLIKKARKGDGRAFSMLIENHERFVYNVVYRITGNQEDARDAAQEAFLKAFRNFESYDESSAFSTWLYRIAVNTAIDYLRKRKKESSISFEDYMAEEKPESVSSSVEEKVISNEGVSKIIEAVNSLDEEFKTVIVLRDMEGMDYKEISEITGCPVGTVKSRLSRGRGKLRSIIKSSVKPESEGRCGV